MSAIYGMVSALVFRRFADGAAVRRATNRAIAQVLEFRLFLDSPALVLRAQRELLRENLRILRLIAMPCGILALLFALLFPAMDTLYGHGPVKVGEQQMVTVRLRSGESPALTLEAPAGIRVETPPVYAAHEREVSWLVRPLGQTSGALRVRDRTIELARPHIAVLGVNWMVWFFVVSSITAMVFRP